MDKKNKTIVKQLKYIGFEWHPDTEELWFYDAGNIPERAKSFYLEASEVFPLQRMLTRIFQKRKTRVVYRVKKAKKI